MLLKEKYEDLSQKNQRAFKASLKTKGISTKQFFDNHSKKPLSLLPLGVFLTYIEILNISKEEILNEEPRLAMLIPIIPRTQPRKKKIFTTQNY